MSVWAVIVAAGRGERLRLDRPKAFANLGGRPLLAESLERLEECAKLGLGTVIAPAATKPRQGLETRAVETLRQAISAALEPRR